MRQVASIDDEALARRFGEYLTSLGIRSRADRQDTAIEIWVFDEDRVAEARKLFQDFLTDPQAGRFSITAPEPVLPSIPLRRETLVTHPRQVATIPLSPRQDITWLVAIATIAIFLIASIQDGGLRLQVNDAPVQRALAYRASIPGADAAQPWRWFTPALVHRNLVLLAFNVCLWLGLAGFFEARRGALRLVILVLITGIAANVGRDYWLFGPRGAPTGLAGVNFGVFGYLWVKSTMDRGSRLDLPSHLITFAIVFFVLSAVGFIPDASIAPPLAGLLAGGLLGYTPGRGNPRVPTRAGS